LSKLAISLSLVELGRSQQPIYISFGLLRLNCPLRQHRIALAQQMPAQNLRHPLAIARLERANHLFMFANGAIPLRR
jgi:hypothetical protein